MNETIVYSDMNTNLQIAQLVPVTEAEGPGRRFAIWFQGCPLRCPGCCNPEMLSFDGGTAMSTSEVLQQIDEAAKQHDIEGVTLIGGEPFAHAVGASILAREIQTRDLSVMIFSGLTLNEIKQSDEPAVAELLQHTDILVDGPYDRETPDNKRRWVGSTNQQIHFLTSRYSADDPRWKAPNTLEIRRADGELTVNGFPAKQAVGMWKRPRNRR